MKKQTNFVQAVIGDIEKGHFSKKGDVEGREERKDNGTTFSRKQNMR